MSEFGLNWGTFGAIVLACAFGLLYNQFVNWCEQRGYSDGYTGLLVVLGVLVTLALAVPFVGLAVVLVVFTLFCCTGAPMVAGDVWRAIKRRELAGELIKKIYSEGSNGDSKNTSNRPN